MNVVAALRSLDACAVSDACDRLGIPMTVVTGIAPLTGATSVAGRAVTVRLGPPPSERAAAIRHLCASAVDAATADDIIVVDHQGRLDCAGWGGMLSRGARQRGCAATLIDGAARDIDEAIRIGYPVFGRGATPRTARGRAVETAWGGPIMFGGIPVRTGDYVIADSTGIVIIPSRFGADVVTAAESIAASEGAMSASIDEGASLGQVMGRNYEAMLRSRSSHDENGGM